jgi:proteasome beta subunit
MTVDEGIDLAARAINAAMGRDSASGNGAAIAVINKKEFRMISEDEIKTRLEKIGK